MGAEDRFNTLYGKYHVKLSDAEVDAYLNRIGLTRGDVTLDLEGLTKLQRSHLWSVPFENIDLFDYDRPVDFGTAEVFDKVVTRNRGGYCFELNAGYMALIEALGFKVHAAGTRILMGADPAGTLMPVAHRASIVTLGGKRYYCDVGFGLTTAPLDPVCLDETGEQDIGGDIYTVEDRPFNNKLIIRHTSHGPVNIFYLNPDPTPVVDFMHINYSMARTAFRDKRMANLRNPDGAMSVDGDILRVFNKGDVTETPIATSDEAKKILTEMFGMSLDDTPLRDRSSS